MDSRKGSIPVMATARRMTTSGLQGFKSLPPANQKEESVKIIKIEECMTEDCYPACPYCSEVRVDGGDVFVCDHPESVGKDIEPCIDSIHPDCPLPAADRTSGQEEGEDADL